MSFSQYLPQIAKAINDYGVEVIFYRDVYVNEVGVRTLKEQMKPITTVKAVIDNSKANGNSKNKYATEGLMKPTQTATIYIAYTPTLQLQQDDYLIIDGIRYTIDMPQDILHYHLLYQCNAEVSLSE